VKKFELNQSFPSLDYALMIDPILKAITAVDLSSGKRVILSKSVK